MAAPISRWIAISVAAFFMANTAACDDRPPPPHIPLGIASQSGWARTFSSPVIQAGDMRKQGLWNDPCVLKINGQYVMYLTTSVNEPFKPPILPFRSVSDDGIKWKLEPETALLSASGTAFVSMETPTVVQFHGKYHMFFTGIMAKPEPAAMSIGHAWSDDGIQWRVSPTPVLTATGNPKDWNGVLIAEPGAVVHGDQILVYFSALAARESGKPPQFQTIGLATTTDGEHFSPQVRVLEQSSLYSADAGYAGYSTPSAFLFNDRIHLVYDVALFKSGGEPDWQQVAIHHAVATGDGEHEFIQDDAPIFTRDDFPWASGEILAPTALIDGDKIKLWFAGHVPPSALGPLIRNGFAGSDFGIGYTEKPAESLRQDHPR